MDYFLELFGSLPRGGPGSDHLTRQAFEMMDGLPSAPRILDIGCGPGVQTLELARVSGGTILGLDNLPWMLERAGKAVSQAGLTGQIELLQQDMTEMDFQCNSFHVVWSEAAIYNLGFENGLKKVKNFLKPGGYVAVSEAVWLRPDPPEEIREWWKQYPEIDSTDQKLKIISSLGYQNVGHRIFPDSAWTDAYYQPLRQRIATKKPDWVGIPEAMGVIEEAELELEMFRKYSEFYGYCFFVMRKSDT